MEERVTRNSKFRVRCAVCNKLTTARLPGTGRQRGNGTVWFPRRHSVSGSPCPGNIMEAEVVECSYAVN